MCDVIYYVPKFVIRIELALSSDPRSDPRNTTEIRIALRAMVTGCGLKDQKLLAGVYSMAKMASDQM